MPTAGAIKATSFCPASEHRQLLRQAGHSARADVVLANSAGHRGRRSVADSVLGGGILTRR